MERPGEKRGRATPQEDPSRPNGARGPDELAFRAFYDRHVAAVLHFLRYQVSDDDRPDVASRTFTFAARHFERFEPRPGQERRKAERSWILTIARNAARTWRQKKREPEQTDFETLESPDNPERDTAAFELAVLLLWTLPEHLRTLYLLHHHEGMTHDDLASELRLPLGTVKSQLRAAQAEIDAKIDRLAAREGKSRDDYLRGATPWPIAAASLEDVVRDVEEEIHGEGAGQLWSEIAADTVAPAGDVTAPPVRGALAYGAERVAAGTVARLTGAKVAALAAAFVAGGAGSYAALHLPAAAPSAAVAALDSTPPPPAATAPATATVAAAATASSAPTARPGRATPHPARSGDAGTFLTEQDAILAARGAFSAGDFAGALRNANKHAKDHPGGAFAAEREAIAIRALAQLGRTSEARARAETFRRAFPNSVFRGAVEVAAGGSGP